MMYCCKIMNHELVFLGKLSFRPRKKENREAYLLIGNMRGNELLDLPMSSFLVLSSWELPYRI